MEANQTEFSGYAVVELFGHGREVGFVKSVYFGTACMFQVDIPALAEREYELTEPQYVGHVWMAKGTKVRRPAVSGRSRLVSPGAVYSLNPCTEEAALAALEATSARPLIAIDIPAALIAASEPDEPDDDEDDPYEDDEEAHFAASEARVRGE